MYVPRFHRVAAGELLDAFVRDHGFGALVTAPDGVPIATHLPLELILDADGKRWLEGHVAKANPQWKHVAAGARCLAIFTGPHTYVSPTWYGHENVPTWNYQAVHLSGTGTLVEDREHLMAMLRRLTRHYEPEGSSAPVFDLDRMSPSLRDSELKGLAAFRILVEVVEAAFKLSQNRNAEDYDSVIRRLRERGDAESLAVADAMEEDGFRKGA